MPVRPDEEKIEYPYRKMYAKRLQRAMEIRGVDVLTLAEKAGVAESTIRKYIRGFMCPKFRELVRISLALDASIDWMMGRKGCKTLVTGKWVWGNEETSYKCTRCGHSVGLFIAGRNYCENCGAKMTGSEEDDGQEKSDQGA